MLSVSGFDDLILPEAPEALAEHLAHSDHHDDIPDKLVQPLQKQSRQDRWDLSVLDTPTASRMLQDTGGLSGTNCSALLFQ